MSPSSRIKSAAKKAEPFSLVPYAVQRRLYEWVLRSILVRDYLGLQDRVHTDFAEIGAVAALLDSDLVFPAAHSIGARVVRLRPHHGRGRTRACSQRARSYARAGLARK